MLSLVPFLALTLAAVPSASQCTDERKLVQPTEHRSATGRWRLEIDPSERRGSGPASYRMELEGELVWEAQHTFTLLDPRIAEDGTVAGHAIPGRWCTELWIAIVGADGTVRRLDAVPRELRACCALCEPRVGRLRLAPDRFDVELLYSGGGSTWQSYRLATGETLLDSPAFRLAEEPPVPSVPFAATTTPTQVPELELTPLRTVRFPGFDSERMPHRRLVDAQGHVWISELRSHVVRSFDAEGVPRLACVPDPDPMKSYRPYDWIAVLPDGRLAGRAGYHEVEFDQRGALVTVARTMEPPRSVLYASQGEPWKVGPVSAERAVVVERGASDRWFRTLACAAVGPDGSLAVVDEPQRWADDGDPTRYVHVFDPDGAARATLPLLAECPTDGLAYDGERFVLIGGGELWAMRANGSCIGRARLPEPLAKARDVFFARAGTEVWLFAPMEPALWVFEARWR